MNTTTATAETIANVLSTASVKTLEILATMAYEAKQEATTPEQVAAAAADFRAVADEISRRAAAGRL